MRALPVDHSDYTFFDFGSGKGKALMLASDYPFRRIRGVEFAPILNATAERNLRVYASPAQRCHDLRAYCMDALECDLPDEPLVCFFFNPFDDSTMRCVLAKVDRSARERPRHVLIVYANVRDVAEQLDVIREQPALRVLAQTKSYVVCDLELTARR